MLPRGPRALTRRAPDSPRLGILDHTRNGQECRAHGKCGDDIAIFVGFPAASPMFSKRSLSPVGTSFLRRGERLSMVRQGRLGARPAKNRRGRVRGHRLILSVVRATSASPLSVFFFSLATPGWFYPSRWSARGRFSNINVCFFFVTTMRSTPNTCGAPASKASPQPCHHTGSIPRPRYLISHPLPWSTS